MEIHSSPGVEEPSPSQSAGDKNLRPVTASGSRNLSKQLSTCSPWKRPHGNGCWRRWMPFSQPSSPSEQSLSTRASIGKCGSVPPKSFMVAQCWECRWSHGSPGFLRPLTPNSLACCMSLCSHHLLPFPWPPPLMSSVPYCMWGLCSECQRREFLSPQPVPVAERDSGPALNILPDGLGRAQSTSGLSVRDWASGLVLVQGAE